VTVGRCRNRSAHLGDGLVELKPNRDAPPELAGHLVTECLERIGDDAGDPAGVGWNGAGFTSAAPPVDDGGVLDPQAVRLSVAAAPLIPI
jgi:hypothetical protein